MKYPDGHIIFYGTHDTQKNQWENNTPDRNKNPSGECMQTTTIKYLHHIEVLHNFFDIAPSSSVLPVIEKTPHGMNRVIILELW